MENFGDISAWLTPAILVGFFLWLRADIRNVRHDLQADIREMRADIRELRADIRALDERLRAVEVEMAEIRGQLTLMRDYILGRNLRQPDDAAEPAPGD